MEYTVVRSGERSRYKRCPTAWYWAWRKGLIPRGARFGALELGTWVHVALAAWYLPGFTRSKSNLVQLFLMVSDESILQAKEEGAPEHLVDEAIELQQLGVAMMEAYEGRYGDDPGIEVISAEIPLEFTLEMEMNKATGVWEPRTVHRLKPDLVYADEAGDIWLMEHKTAKSIRTEHLLLNDQGPPYAAMAERGLRKAGVIGKRDEVRGVMYNFLRKQLPDLRKENAKGEKLNQNGSVSKKQPAPFFLRYPLTLTKQQKRRILTRVSRETYEIQTVTTALKTGHLELDDLKKTGHWSCPKHCEFWKMCVAHERGSDIRTMEKSMFIRQDPYAYEEDTADEPISFEMG
jgi:hypothetical protein